MTSDDVVSASAAPSAVISSVATMATSRATPSSPREIEIPRRHIEFDLLVRKPFAATVRRSAVNEQQAGRTTHGRVGRLDPDRHGDSADAEQIRIETVDTGRVWTPGTIGELPLRQF